MFKAGNNNLQSWEDSEFGYCLWSKIVAIFNDFAISNCLFGAFQLTKKADPSKCFPSEHGIGFDTCLSFSLWDGNGLVKM